MENTAVNDTLKQPELSLECSAGTSKTFTHLVLDYSGTLALDGAFLPGVAGRLASLAASLRIIVLTADTFGTARAQLAGLPVEVRIISTGSDKSDFMRQLGGATAIAIGNGRNDVPLLEAAGLALAVIGPEGAAAELLGVADVVVRDIGDALDLISLPLRLKATLRA
jgi:soluble P-type ATPase